MNALIEAILEVLKIGTRVLLVPIYVRSVCHQANISLAASN
jgi:hypothetical protein